MSIVICISFCVYPLITYYWTASLLILDHSYLLGNLINSRIAENKSFRTSKILISNFRTFYFPTRYEWSKIRGTVQ